MAAVIELHDISYWREESPVLQEVDWTVQRGEHWALIGENGAGKTTLLQIIHGDIWPTTGTVETLGARYGTIDLREHKRRIGWVTASLGTHLREIRPDETALEVAVSGGRAVIGLWEPPTPEEAERAREILASFGGARLANRPFYTLSQGEQQSVLLSRAWMARAELLILDEPCTGLDLRAREQLLASIQRLGGRPDAPTLLYVSHHVEEIVPLFTHALLVKQGRIVGSGPKGDVLTGSMLSDAFEIGLDVRWQSGRPWVAVV